MPRTVKPTRIKAADLKALLPKRSESKEQSVFFEKVQAKYAKYSHWKTIHAIPNGGFRNGREAAKLKREGVRPGVPDICCPFARGKYISLRIEMKIKGNKLTPSQQAMIPMFEALGNKVVVCYSAEEAFAELEAYENDNKVIGATVTVAANLI